MIMGVMVFAGRACGVGLIGLSCDYGCDYDYWQDMSSWVGRTLQWLSLRWCLLAGHMVLRW